jgi:hypothetical protein
MKAAPRKTSILSRLLLSALFILNPALGRSEAPNPLWNLQIEGAAAWQTQNDQRVPGKGGTRFSLADFGQGPLTTYRIYLGGKITDRSEWRLLYAPLEVRQSGLFEQSVLFQDQIFQPGVRTETVYKFNSYRATYSVSMEPWGLWNWSWGFTAKIRDAEVRLTQGAASARKTNVGFVPLLHFRAHRSLSENWRLLFDFDGLLAPQGRALDAAFFLDRQLTPSGPHLLLGYRTVEGGADNRNVFNFAWFHFLTVGMKKEF